MLAAVKAKPLRGGLRPAWTAAARGAREIASGREASQEARRQGVEQEAPSLIDLASCQTASISRTWMCPWWFALERPMPRLMSWPSADTKPNSFSRENPDSL